MHPHAHTRIEHACIQLVFCSGGEPVQYRAEVLNPLRVVSRIKGMQTFAEVNAALQFVEQPLVILKLIGESTAMVRTCCNRFASTGDTRRTSCFALLAGEVLLLPFMATSRLSSTYTYSNRG